MSVTLIIGSQWGDEGKGKIVDFLSLQSDYIIRFHGGNNAGHTVVNKYGKFPMHLVPSGIFSKRATGIISNGVILDLEVLISEIEMLKKSGIKLKNRLLISPRCHLIMPYHKLLDQVYEEAKGKNKTGTTGRGIGPTYADKVSYNGIRIWDLLDTKRFSEKLEIQLKIKNGILKSLGKKPLSAKTIEKTFFEMRGKIMPYIAEPFLLLQKALKEKKKILLEGAHAVFLDPDWGTYPYVTASTIVAGGINSQAGIPPKFLSDVVGVVKAYTTRVGEGPFPTELTGATGEILRKAGNEFGTTTGRPRRCGWFDAELIRFAALLNGFTSIAITKLDVLDSFSEIKVCVGYKYKGEKATYSQGDDQFLMKVVPVYKTLKGWQATTNGLTDYKKLPLNAKKYIEEIEKLTGVSVKYISTGPHRHDIIVK
ncbi:MAG: Adenylosuccinate synthetase [Candidatus Levybacteria bacterium GW2011_GWB1_39_7]|nr:MAG: Adenylosuccinate synthetase [Candidatus Levybacteria bacterium GW2011_GWA1_39_11]KKR25234.1 MAG: Adenylosuccinate synthetase [Candidatus Levybacteria bacterium GW2011_GWB1_39_7]KKR27505.1 MAG: Adenylosuccinate synthetase [Microgenomates group bacterium GW2011_GWC1_39_7]OGH45336.1 MAG: adenylosuccinate synthase [Candidatus Levybacteria bacterium RIFCSPLOWO2_02_FULL_39_26]OGH48407.1 MAG: adenylosuccinate synthase [Candidatus Levybacteria bacterium RIFCSPLOWO2_12_FULL_39_17]